MNWNNETVLKFLELYQINSCIWDPQNECHKNRQRVNDAWINIKQNLGATCSIQDLKKKKESLMSAYRNYKNKIKKSDRSGAGSNDIYQPTWFAFSTMDSFLGSVYTCNTTTSTEDEEIIEDKSNLIVTEAVQDQELLAVTPTPVRRRQKNPPELVDAKQHVERAFNYIKRISEQQPNPINVATNNDDESTIFGQLIASKIRKLSEADRDIMMVQINQLFVDKHILNSSSMYDDTPTPPQSETALREEHDSFSNREFITPNTIYEGSIDNLKDFVIFKPK